MYEHMYDQKWSIYSHSNMIFVIFGRGIVETYEYLNIFWNVVG